MQRHQAERRVHVSQASRRLLLQQKRRIGARFLKTLNKIEIGFDFCVAGVAHEGGLQEFERSLKVVVARCDLHDGFVAAKLDFDVVALAVVGCGLAVRDALAPSLQLEERSRAVAVKNSVAWSEGNRLRKEIERFLVAAIGVIFSTLCVKVSAYEGGGECSLDTCCFNPSARSSGVWTASSMSMMFALVLSHRLLATAS